MARHSLSQMIAEVEREIRMRRQVYPGLVTRKRYRHSEAMELIAIMESVLQTLQYLNNAPPSEEPKR